LNRVRQMFYRMKTYNIKHIKKQQLASFEKSVNFY
jgi:hypothetical protein